ncbi:MAG: exonuclease domain-containing protein [Eubacterium sp.]|nr:exonuclease domain-containing protein [Eubacterium sp.]
MYYIIFDLEWNSAYNYSSQQFMNEIIEIGALKLDERLNVVGTYKQLIYPHFTKKLSSRCKRLTKITNEEIKAEGKDFLEVFRDFSRWARGDKNVFMSWSNSDLFVLSNNFVQNTGSANVDFMKYYCDAQKFCMRFIDKDKNPDNNQVSLERCAEIFGISVDTEKLHRALADCYVTHKCLKKVFDAEIIKGYIKECNSSYFERLLFKPYSIEEMHSAEFEINNIDLVCPNCGTLMDIPDEFELINKSFKSNTKCNYCKRSYWIYVHAKKLYDGVSVKTGYVEMNKKRARKLQRKKKESGQR